MADTIINGGSLLLYKRTKNSLATSAVVAGGTGYAVNDTFYIQNGSSRPIGKVTTAAGGIVSAYSIVSAGSDCTVATPNTTINIIGTGSGLTINLQTLGVTGGTYQATGHSTTHSLSISLSPRETSSKASGTFASREGGRLDVSGSAEGLAVYADNLGLTQLTAMINNREIVFLMFAENAGAYTVETTPDTAKFYGSGFFVLTSVEISAPDQDNVTYSISFEHSSGFTLTN